MKYISRPPVTVLFLILIYSCSHAPATEESVPRKTLSLQFIDSSVKPGDQFFLFANGKWYDTATILPTESRAGARLEMDFKTRAEIKNVLLEAASADSPKGSIEQKVGDYFASGMDTTTIEKAGYDPIKIFLRQIDSIKTAKDVLQFAASQIKLNNGMLLGQYVLPDDKNSARNILYYYQTGLGLPDRDYYFKPDAATMAVVKSYQAYISKLFALIGDDSATAAKNTETVYNLEKKLAQSHKTNVELRDPQANYHKVAIASLEKKMPNMGWKKLLEQLQVKTDSMNMAQPAYYEKLNVLLKTVPVSNWRTYLRFHLMDDFAPFLSNGFVLANFNYADKTLSGQQQLKERWERVYAVIDQTLGEALGQLYVRKYFSAEAKHRIAELVDNLQKAFATRMDKLDWMSDSTKQKAKEKLAAITKKVAYPDKWKDYSQVEIDRHHYVDNILSSAKNEYRRLINKIDQPVDKSEWGMTPPTDNAYYNPYFNEIVFPAGILQYPMFDPGSDDAMNYGGIGMVIGHEMTHAFDDQGAQYDKDGNLKNWLSKEDYKRFKEKGEWVINLYNSFVVLDSVHVNGKLTQGENTADIGGIAIAYDAFKLTREGQDTATIDGLTPDQRFFLSFAQTWRKKVKDESLRQQVNTDPHSPGIYRVLGPLMNFTPFYKAFNVKEDNKMYRADSARIKIW